MTQLRWKRNSLLSQCDMPWGLSDYNHPDKSSWITYRQQLRDLPNTANPQVDEYGTLINVTWPTPPNSFTANTA